MDFASATDLVRWANLREAQARLPQLVRRLISATANNLESLSMRAGEGVQLPGWDGFVTTQTGDAHVPSGTSVWEMGVNNNPGSKANEDYLKRTQDSEGVDPSEATFVFVTPRRWPRKDAWVAEKIQEGTWKDVIVYDADDLEIWLERAPAVHAWISALLGKNPHEAQNLENWWDDWSHEVNPPFSPSLLLSGRDKSVQELLRFLSSAASAMSFSGDSQDEVVAFIAAALLENSNPAANQVLDQTLIVRTPAAWQQLALSERPLVLLPLYERPSVALAVRHGHHVVVPLRREVSSGNITELPRLRRDGIEKALSEAGMPRDRASTLATLGRRSLLSLRRVLAINRDVQSPIWSLPEHARDILPALLAGAWRDDMNGDRDAVAALAGRPYADVVQALIRWANSSDPPVRRVGNIWMITAKQDAWQLIARSLTTDDLSHFRTVALDVIGADDPTFGLSSTERFLASIQGRERLHSGQLVEGLTDTLALIASMSEEVELTNGHRGQSEVDVIVRRLLDEANEDETGRHWIILSDTLPLIAEAAPDVFLRAVEIGLRDSKPTILKMFQDSRDSIYMFSTSSAHTGLLWGLETLAWSVTYLSRVAISLAKLARLDPGGQLANRPFHSLTEILILWRSGTGATLQQRLEVVDLLRHREPDIAWKLMLRLIPSMHDHASYPHPPTWRDWKPESEETVTAEFYMAVEGIATRVIEDVGINSKRWLQLLSKITGVPTSVRAEFIAKMSELTPEHFEEDERASLYEALLGIVNQHREFPDALWAMSTSEVDRLSEILLHLKPNLPMAKHAWLFKLGALRSFGTRREENERYNALSSAQAEAVREVHTLVGLTGVLTWAEQFDDHFIPQIGWGLGRIELESAVVDEIFGALTSEIKAHRGVARGYVAQTSRAHGEAWATWVEETLGERGGGWSPSQKAEFLTLFPVIPLMWDVAERAGEEVEHEYWSRIQPYGIPDNEEDLIRVARELLQHGRPYEAVEFLDFHAENISDKILFELSAKALESAAQTPPPTRLESFSYHVGQHLDRLAEAGFDMQRLAMLEWTYLPLFRHEGRKLQILHRELSTDPEFFTQVVSWVYSAESIEAQELPEREFSKAQSARDLLSTWRLVPGTREDGSLDKEELYSWVTEARRLLTESDRSKGGENQIGKVLRYGPKPHDDVWPAEAIQDLIDDVASEFLEDGFQVEVYNSRGVTMRDLTEGGEQERVLAAQYKRYAEKATLIRPRTAALLTRIARSYEQDAERHDTSAALTEDTWR